MAAAKNKNEVSAIASAQPAPAEGAVTVYGAYGTKTGFENVTPADLKQPFIRQLQPMSPEVTDGLPGAVNGAFFNTSSGEIIPMNEGFVVVPLGKKHHFVEWRPRENGGGFVASHAPGSPAVLAALPHPDPKKKNVKVIQAADGTLNDLIETHDVFILLLDKEGKRPTGDCAIFSFTSTKIKACRDWWNKMYTMKPRAPLFAVRAKITGFKDPRQNKGQFWNVKVAPFPAEGDWKASLIDPVAEKDLLDTAFGFFEMYEAGGVKPDYDKAGDSTEAAGDSDVPF
jgi:hypothetical protein